MNSSLAMQYYTYKRWTKEEEDYLESHYLIKDLKDLAQYLNRSEESVRMKLQRMKLCVKRNDLILPKHLSTAFNVHIATVKRWINKFNMPVVRTKKKHYNIFIDVEKFWKWAEQHQDIVPFYKYKRFSLFPEPEWLSSCVTSQVNNKRYHSPTMQEIALIRHLRQDNKSTWEEIAQELNRSISSIQHIYYRYSNKIILKRRDK